MVSLKEEGMLCDICGKNEAIVHVTEILDNKIAELHLCEECAKKKGAKMSQPFSLADLLAGLSDISAVVGPEEGIKQKCPDCGLTYKDFRKTGRLGCGQCYDTFKESLVPLLKRIRGSNQHVGKFPARKVKIVRVGMELAELRDKLAKAIQLERYEEAAKLRDQVRALESESRKKGKRR